jgi:hypothetical protein
VSTEQTEAGKYMHNVRLPQTVTINLNDVVELPLRRLPIASPYR